MYKIDFSHPLNVHFIGIGGISMSGLAEILMHNGFHVTGSDAQPSKILQHLEQLGAKVSVGHYPENIEAGTELVVYTAAVKADNIEYVTTLEKGIPIMDRAELLGQIMGNYEISVGISGTHGKTTTTSMISQILLDAQLDPTVSVGGMLSSIGGNLRVGNSRYFVTEACEYANSFLKFRPYIAIILNIEEDHLDFFKDLADIRNSFKQYLTNVQENGYIIINSDIEDLSALTEGLKCKVITYGKYPEKSDFSATNITFDAQGYAEYDLVYKGEITDHVKVSATGIHNVYNSVSTIATSYVLGLDMESVKHSLGHFDPPKRRFEYKGSIKGLRIIDDYAHHPSEIQATLTAAKKIEHDKLWVVFQPHTYSRTKSFLGDFAKALSLADGVILADIYAAREKDPGDIHSKNLLDELLKLKNNCYYFPSFDEIEIFILENCVPQDVLITMGAGNIYLIGEDLLNA